MNDPNRENTVGYIVQCLFVFHTLHSNIPTGNGILNLCHQQKETKSSLYKINVTLAEFQIIRERLTHTISILIIQLTLR